MIPYARHDVSEEDIETVVKVLRSDWLTQGPVVERFESAFSDYCGAKYALAVVNASAGLHLACRALGVNKNSLVWVSPNTFVASANCARYCGSEVDFVDIDAQTYNISVDELEKRLCEAKRTGQTPDVLIVTHFAGQPCDLEQIYQLSKEYGFSVIEDAAHAVGAEYRGKKIGGCQHSDICVFSFHPVKIITSGEGGMITTNREDLYQRMADLRVHGVVRDSARMECNSDGPWYYQQQELGYNYRLSDIHAALGLSQMKRVDAFLSRRRELANRYKDQLSNVPIQLPLEQTDSKSSWHLYVVRIQLENIAQTRKEIFETLKSAGIGVNVHYIPVHVQPYYRALGFQPGDFPEAEKYYNEALTLPLFPALTDSKQEFIIDHVREIIK